MANEAESPSVGNPEAAWLQSNPPHPGENLREGWIGEDGVTEAVAAEILEVSHQTLSRVLNGQAPISPELALRLEAAGWSTARFWMALQVNYDLAAARRLRQTPADA